VPPPYESTLTDPRQRFLASITEHGLELGLRSPEDFIRHFSPRVIMLSLDADASLRASLLEQTIGVKRKVGLRKSPTSAGEDLQIALDEGVTHASAIVSIFTADERARHLDASELWSYATESEFWTAARDDERWGVARDHVAFFLESGLANELLTPRDIVEGLTLARLVEHLPAALMESLLASALRQARIQEPFSENEMLTVAPPSVLAEHVPLVEIWETVIVPRLAPSTGITRSAPIAPSGRESSVGEPSASTSIGSPPGPPKIPVRAPVPVPLAKVMLRPTPVARPIPVAATEADGGKRSSRAPRRSVPPRPR
jgi:hypothetical protein